MVGIRILFLQECAENREAENVRSYINFSIYTHIFQYIP